MRTSLRSIPPPPTTGGPDLLAASAGIGDRLVRDVVWYRGQCNWVGVEAAHGAGRYRPIQRALGPDLAGGTAGVALFLGQLYAATGDGEVRRTALGAIGQALAHANRVPARGLYKGRLGIAYAAAQRGLLLREEGLLQRGTRLAGGRSRRGSGTAAFDLTSGTAGAIAGLIALARLLDDERLVRRAGQLGDELAAAARRGSEGWSWPVPGERLFHGLCGISHGAAGAAWALLELFALTGQRRHRDVAERALDYERHWFDAQEANWPDLRGVRRCEPRGSFRSPYPSTWSHGAPGIALTRLRAWTILGDERYRTEAAIALDTTAAGVERALIVRGADFTLGHGLAGSADVLLLGAELFPDAAAQRASIARRVGEVGIGRYGASIDGWPCGVPAGPTPGLLAGHAGIGLFYLRLHDRTVPSPLLIGVAAG
ncbi:MAG: lantibiotic biosynthesis protein [Solirubrobacteraceae bacterium]|jgi:lantibiotic modifying enzyme|nr:lantibiotic biosynthesis protein [Solirubrobacteraceae bacterium]